MTKFNDYITIKEASKILGICEMTLRRWDNSGRFKSVRHPVNKYRLYRKEDLERLLAKLEKPEEPPKRPETKKDNYTAIDKDVLKDEVLGITRRFKYFKKHRLKKN